MSPRGLQWIVLQCWLYSFSLNIALGSLQLFGFYFATNQPLKRGQRSSVILRFHLLGLKNPGIRAVVQYFPPARSESVDIKAAALGAWLADCCPGIPLPCLQMHFFFFLLFSLLTLEWSLSHCMANNRNDLMTDISDGERVLVHVFMHREKWNKGASEWHIVGLWNNKTFWSFSSIYVRVNMINPKYKKMPNNLRVNFSFMQSDIWCITGPYGLLVWFIKLLRH